MMSRPRLIRDRCNVCRPETSRRARKDHFDLSVPLSDTDSRAVERKKPSAAGASSGLKLSNHRISQDRSTGTDRYRNGKTEHSSSNFSASMNPGGT